MSTLMSPRALLPTRDTTQLLIKWIVALLVPLAVFTFLWSGEAIVNNVLLGLVFFQKTGLDLPTLILAALFILVFYVTVITLVGYVTAADSGQRGMIELWVDILFFLLVPLFLVIEAGLVLGMALGAVVWIIYLFARERVRRLLNYTPPHPPPCGIWR